jgi:hypothetical protein
MIDGHHHGTRSQNREKDRDKFRAIFQEDSHPIPGLYLPSVPELPDSGDRTPRKIGIGMGRFPPKEGDFVRMLTGRMREGGGKRRHWSEGI